MPEPNFWYWFLAGLTNVLMTVVGELPTHAVIGLANITSEILVFSTVPLLVFVGTFVDLRILAIVLGIFLTVEIAKGLMAVWRMILKLIPFLG